MAFLEGYFQTNNNMRIIRIFFMVVLASLLIAALLPTGSKQWLNQYVNDGDGYYPSLSTACYYRELSMPSFVRRGPKIWSMLFSVTVVAFSYIHCGMRLFDPTTETSRKYFRTWPGYKIKQLLHSLERRALCKGFWAKFWHVPYLSLYAVFTSCRALYDISESMLLEIIWLTFAMAWGTIKVWETRASAAYNYDGINFTFNDDVREENTWTFGQTLPLILLLLPLLSMAQAYLDNDAKAHEANTTESLEETAQEKGTLSSSPVVEVGDENCTNGTEDILPRYPFDHFTSHTWYRDHILLLLCQILLVTGFALWVLTALANVFGISAILRNRLFLIWILAMVPLASMLHLVLWYIAALIVCRWEGAERWLKGEGKSVSTTTWGAWWRNITVGKVVYWILRLGLVGGCLMFTFFLSLEISGPDALEYGEEVTSDTP
ncbi:ADP-ribosylation factor GTPase activating protein, ER-Golgi transport [Neocucurbitaria cava]|uniref:ADP-ribosylation factor GTPase activating protein, ER-Golgi transport n=1 Tax=Neocucurbitaria cava TaxID=798079 RepID=A0A9W9CHT2_9PLEO|nr:ADP-ribosylation factor GTPase activating protein, ER-Golgi transport [Neocucurbitaria cava]